MKGGGKVSVGGGGGDDPFDEDSRGRCSRVTNFGLFKSNELPLRPCREVSKSFPPTIKEQGLDRGSRGLGRGSRGLGSGSRGDCGGVPLTELRSFLGHARRTTVANEFLILEASSSSFKFSPLPPRSTGPSCTGASIRLTSTGRG